MHFVFARRLFVTAGLGLSLVACSALTREEAREALDEAQLCSQALTLIGNSVTLTENFTIGGAVTAAADNLYDFYTSQMPCAATSLDGNTLRIEFGATGDSCTHQGMTFSGTHEITVTRNDADQIIVDHVWTDLKNDEISVSGTAHVTWTGQDDPSRHVEHDLVWTRLSDGRMAHGSGDRTQRPLDGDLAKGISVEGSADWEGDSGKWQLSISDVEMRWVDPVPQAGSYRLDTPFDKFLTLEFERSNSTNVHITATSGFRSYEFDVRTAP